jgi:hypothetical protein
MARQKWCREYKATTACTVQLLDKMGTKELLDLEDTGRYVQNEGKKKMRVR